ncbi:hypothetical protein NQ117_16650 [Paenibacillus sp. SC116]|uniref:hypothetical protein n=1 Tax=Paenibacillus sp. SC116 TaxID=2968986 RepID=UPI00215B7252|nr:hypothetical protein [Paenibacillus sp. SC116]MCR8845314.1 hypothetical protein [Paenibacillus sp. SC116]
MYLTAQKNVKVLKQLKDIYKQLEDLYASQQNLSVTQHKVKITEIRSKLQAVLHSCELEDLKVIYAVVSIGCHERGERHFYANNTIEIIELELCESEEELLNKHSKYIAFLNEEELSDYFLSQVRLTQDLNEGMKILKL